MAKFFFGVGNLWERTVSAECWVIHQKLFGSWAFSQNFHLKKSFEITIFYVVDDKTIYRFKAEIRRCCEISSYVRYVSKFLERFEDDVYNTNLHHAEKHDQSGHYVERC